MMVGVLGVGALSATHVARRGSFWGCLLLPRYIAMTSVQQQRDLTAQQQHQGTAAARPVHEIPGPRVYPLVGNLPAMISLSRGNKKDIHKIWSTLAQQYGPILKIQQPGVPNMVAVVNPDDIETVMRSTMENPTRYGLDSLKKIRRDAVDNYFDKKAGLLTENGEEWWRVRSRVQTPMMKIQNVSSYLTKMDQVTLEFMDRIAAMQTEYGEMPSDFQLELYKWALESVSLVALDRRVGCLEPNIAEDSEPMKLIKIVNEVFQALTVTEINLPLWKIFPTPSYKKLERSHQTFLEIADRNICQTEAALLSKGPSDNEEELSLMERLLQTPGLTRKDVVTLILDMLFAGIDTTSHTLGFTLYLLARNPEVQVRLQEEVDRVLVDLQGPLTSKHLAQLSYLKAVIKESLRIFPLTIGNSRSLDRDIVLSGYNVPKGWMAITLNMMSGWDEAYFPQPKEFIPERWLRHKPLGPIHPYASLPFSTGTRMCIGRRIAEQELYTFLARVMHRFTIDYKYEDMDVAFRLLMMPSKPLKFTFSERK